MISNAPRINFLPAKTIPRLLAAGTVFIALTAVVQAQSYPDKVRGYRVHQKPIVVEGKMAAGNGDQFSFEFGKPKLADVSLTGIRIKIDGRILSPRQSGSIDFLTFHDFELNGTPVEVEEYNTGFELKKGEATFLPEPVSIFLPAHRVVQAAWNEMNDSSETWRVNGRILVFGRFRKMGFSFKRVVPVIVDVVIPNPLLSTAEEGPVR